jgi:site-specific DNA-methyltransferase (adenine-specific)
MKHLQDTSPILSVPENGFLEYEIGVQAKSIIGNSRVYLMDCMDLLRQTPDKYFNLCIVDPPYGIDINMNMGRRKGKRKKHEDKNWDGGVPSADYFKELQRVSQNQIIWGGNYFDLPPTQCFLIWDKAESMYDRSFAECEQAWTSFKTSARLFKMCPNQTDRVHPTQKPIALYKWILKRFSKEGDKILDTHLGSGSSRIAAYIMGFDFYGCEIDKDYFEAQEKRFKQQTAQQSLFNYEKSA